MSQPFLNLQPLFFRGVRMSRQSRRGFWGSYLPLFSRVCESVARRRGGSGTSFLRGRSEVDQLIHNQQAAGSSPAPATTWIDPDTGELCRSATRGECALMLAVSLVGSVLLVALIFALGWFLGGVK